MDLGKDLMKSAKMDQLNYGDDEDEAINSKNPLWSNLDDDS